jgi:hypothetical protein
MSKKTEEPYYAVLRTLEKAVEIREYDPSQSIFSATMTAASKLA